MSAVCHRLLPLIIIVALTGGTARAQQDFDANRSGAQLFASNCAQCHRSPRGLAKDRFSWTLSHFLQQHYTSSPASAQTLTAYLQSADASRTKPRPAARKSRPTATSVPPLRPPAPVPAR
jgi:mono/diheme cytochrome c family protein